MNINKGKLLLLYLFFNNSFDDELKELFKRHYDGINTTFSFFFISFFIFIIQFIAYCCNPKIIKENDVCETLFYNLNHVIMLITFFICQFLYLIDCMIIPCYLQSIKNLQSPNNNEKTKDLLKNIEKKYIALTVVCLVFLFFILFLDIIILNLFKGICCKMKRICRHTQKCCIYFGVYVLDMLGCILGIEIESEEITELRKKEKEIDNQINNVKGDIKNLLVENMEININNI